MSLFTRVDSVAKRERRAARERELAQATEHVWL